MTKAMTEEEARQVLQGKRVLIIEDEPDLQARLSDVFDEATGVKPVTHGSKQDGLNALTDAGDETPFDLAIVDVRLPKDDPGYQANVEDQDRWLEAQKVLNGADGGKHDQAKNKLRE